MDKVYNPKQTEEKIYHFWQKSGYFNSNKLKTKSRRLKAESYYTILLPPPNITGSLHMGHALNATIIDILIRFKRMRGFRASCLPGTDHAGIATQNAVEKDLKKKGIGRFDLGREKFIQAVWEWKEKYGHIILEQLKKLGLSCDWSRTRFTMDPEYNKAVKESFVHYYKKGLIYRGERVINWCPRCQTSLSDLEIEYQEEKSHLWYLRYPLKSDPNLQIPSELSEYSEHSDVNSDHSDRYIVVATTRPETMLGDAAVAVNPQDKRYQNLIGQKAILPLQNREIPIIADKAVDPDFGTGAVKVTPTHNLLDAEIAERHRLPSYQVISEKAQMTKEAGPNFEGLPVSAAREKVIEELTNQNLIEKIEGYQHNVARCYRCQTKIEPIPSQQWFLTMAALTKAAAKAVRSQKTKIIPKKFEKTYFDWLKNIKDWCISRQIWWGHQLPVWFCRNQTGISNSQFLISKQTENLKLKIKNSSAEKFVVSIEKPRRCPFCKNCDMKQSADVLDTWFSSALWPFAGLSSDDLKKFYPSAVLVTARDIINLWVGRMIFSGIEFLGREPFAEVFIHPTILTKEGKRMSKSLGTGLDPLNLIDNFGADATRFGIIWQAMTGQDIHWDETAVFAGKKFCNKIWNASRFILMNKPSRIDADLKILRSGLTRIKNLTLADKKILKQLKATQKSVSEDIENFRFGPALRKIYDFFWHRFCDEYIEISKSQISNLKSQKTTKAILLYVLLESLKILHPFMPFITEEIYQKIPLPEAEQVRYGAGKKKNLLMIESWF